MAAERDPCEETEDLGLLSRSSQSGYLDGTGRSNGDQHPAVEKQHHEAGKKKLLKESYAGLLQQR